MNVMVGLGLIAALALSGCDGLPQTSGMSAYCEENPAVCILVGAVIAGGAVAAISASHRHSTPAAPPALSDSRLKADLQQVGALPNGLPLYAYHYKGDDRVFVGVIAQEVLARSDLRQAVHQGADGFYRVDYEAIGARLINPVAMQIAGEQAALQF